MLTFIFKNCSYVSRLCVSLCTVQNCRIRTTVLHSTQHSTEQLPKIPSYPPRTTTFVQLNPERCRSSCHRSQEVGTHNARFAGSSLAANQTVDHVQDSRSGLQVSTRHGSAVPTSLLRTGQHAPAVVFDPSVPVFWLFHAPEQTTAIVVLPSMDLVCGTVFLMN